MPGHIAYFEDDELHNLNNKAFRLAFHGASNVFYIYTFLLIYFVTFKTAGASIHK